MARRGSSIGFFGIFGRSEDLRRLDTAMRAAGLHPALVPEGVKLAIVNLMKDHAPTGEPPPQAYQPVADLVAYCILGKEHFNASNGEERCRTVESRIERAPESGEGADAQMILLTLHAGLAEREVVERYDLRAEEG
ncbi:hypothetical protein L598_004900000200 [Mesorhizobium sp. J18]|uniref:hypothetical protein n=1 Tax=Mesorhizobium sp. J18 TaxID=935263 RepID=UPI00119B8DBF|nr:hypothetical protein [Mesorhizobium sp. J18]TWG92589.1 hypothetical protein L598_004900000200 [Mesorhizobium sp. J18]